MVAPSVPPEGTHKVTKVNISLTDMQENEATGHSYYLRRYVGTLLLYIITLVLGVVFHFAGHDSYACCSFFLSGFSFASWVYIQYRWKDFTTSKCERCGCVCIICRHLDSIKDAPIVNGPIL